MHIVPSESLDEGFQTAFGFFEDYDGNSVLIVHTVTAMLVLEAVEDMAPYSRRLHELHESALSEKGSTEMINSVALL
ncbi:hypothetical protein DMC64_20125 [Amycolatopsis sp. WAC 04197]|nr:hypothetical protein DMC64_20125 [Amycolatopsis sp. WAC 04197]